MIRTVSVIRDKSSVQIFKKCIVITRFKCVEETVVQTGVGRYVSDHVVHLRKTAVFVIPIFVSCPKLGFFFITISELRSHHILRFDVIYHIIKSAVLENRYFEILSGIVVIDIAIIKRKIYILFTNAG